jgi:hypothetical protein
MNTCESYAALLDAFAEGDLFTEDMIQVQKHLNDCPACQAYLDDLFAMRAAFPTIEDTEVPEGFADRVMAAVAAHPRTAAPAEPAPRKKKSPWTKVVLPLAACCAIVVLLQGGPFGAKKETAFDVSYSREPAKTEEAAPAAEAPTAALEDSVAVAEEGVMEAKSIHAPVAAQTEPAEEPKTAPTADEYLEDNDRSINEPVYLYAAELPAEAAEFLKDYTPADETTDAVYYHLSAAEYTQLESRLADAGISYLAEAGLDPTTDLVLVVLSK